jgi:hypothetical protein
LYRSLVLDQKLATSASAGQNGLKWEGYFEASAVARPGRDPREVEEALYQELEKLKTTRVEDRELQKVKNRFAADTFRRLQSNFALMLQLLIADNNRGWRTFNTDPATITAVTAEDVQRVAQTYFKPERRAVALYYTKAADATAAPDPLLADLSDEERAQVGQMRAAIAQMPVEQAKQMLQQVSQKEASAPPDKRKLLGVLKTLLQQRIDKGGL